MRRNTEYLCQKADSPPKKYSVFRGTCAKKCYGLCNPTLKSQYCCSSTRNAPIIVCTVNTLQQYSIRCEKFEKGLIETWRKHSNILSQNCPRLIKNPILSRNICQSIIWSALRVSLFTPHSRNYQQFFNRIMFVWFSSTASWLLSLPPKLVVIMEIIMRKLDRHLITIYSLLEATCEANWVTIEHRPLSRPVKLGLRDVICSYT